MIKRKLSVFLLSVSLMLSLSSSVKSQNLLSKPILIWYSKLYGFERASLMQLSTLKISKEEKDFARLNYYWQELLCLGTDELALKELNRLTNLYHLEEDLFEKVTPMQIFMAATSRAFQARAYALKSGKINGAIAYMQASNYLSPLRQLQEAYPEIKLLVHLYDAGINQLNTNLLYSATLWVLPPAENANALEDLAVLKNNSNVFVSAQAHYFRYKIINSFAESGEYAKEDLNELMKIYPKNPILWLENYKLSNKRDKIYKQELWAQINTHSALSVAAKKHLTSVLNEISAKTGEKE
jgi:hypothetical protein